ncbi:MAG: Asp-tRNA(Asn)/Glu-tRNA(Gln) amidotransferase subunit GatC [Opitutales bacterium]|jgi:aspartyl-tRNA(Asn)/glutamyl-tRNA(Gln) amidotransferase subunit C|nr:Asp-tRNA(Asn)/Glu-tRNA(Gln) amidotransferase subunit GatC [Opitutales bacterium]
MSEDAPMDIDYVANLARIELSDEEKTTYQRQLGDVLKYFEKLQELEVDGVEPTAHAFPRHNVWDQDESKQGFSASEALKNAPQSRQDQVVVPKVIEE